MNSEPGELDDDEPYREVVSKEDFMERAEEISNQDEEDKIPTVNETDLDILP